MTKKIKLGGIVKGTMMGVSLVLCASMLPVGAFAALSSSAATAEEQANDNIKITANVKRDGVSLNKEIGRVSVGENYFIPKAEFKGSAIINETGDEAKQSITVRFGNKSVDLNKDGDEYYFTAKEAGNYIVSYNVIGDDGRNFSHEYKVVCQVSEAKFEFSANSQEIIPSIYDIALLNSKNLKNKDIVLPSPSVVDEEGEKIELSSQDFFLSKQEGKKHQVVVKVMHGTEQVELVEKEGKFVISGETLCATNQEGEYTGRGVYSVYFTYYEDGVFVTQETRTFEVKSKHYVKSDDENKSGYSLKTNFVSTPPTSAVTGVEKELPAISGEASDTKESGAVSVYYTIKVEYQSGAGAAFVDKTTECLSEDDQHLFTPCDDGNYKISYFVNDFYGNNNSAEISSAQFSINGVKDTKAPKVFAINGDNQEKDIDYRITSKQAARNIIVYAIGAEDNVAEGIKLVREVRDNGSSKARITIDDYDDYNLIFVAKSASETSVYKQIISDNYYLRKDMQAAGITTASQDSEIKTWLIDHKYLIVINDISKNPITNTAFTFAENATEEEKKAVLEDEGFAYINYNYTFNTSEEGTTYRFYYLAEDKAGNKTEDIYYTTKFTNKDVLDEDAPTLKFSDSLQQTYLKTDKIEFAAPVATDTQDASPRLVFAYRYLDSKNQPMTSAEKTEKISFSHNKDVSGQKWYNSQKNVEADGFMIFDEKNTNDKFEIDFAKDLKNQDFKTAQYVEIFAYAEDDHGNLGFFDRVITIAQQTEESNLDLEKVKDYTEGLRKTNEPIALPTLFYSDSFLDYMTADVTVYYLGEEGNDKKGVVQAQNMKTEIASDRGLFIVQGGEFTASRAGNYQVVISARDAGGNEIATFFDYTVETNAQVEKPAIDNLNSDTVSLEVDYQYSLPAPTVAISDSAAWGYYGIKKEDDVNIATNYTITMVKASNSDYDLTKSHFVARSEGTYELIYNVNIIRYKLDHFSETPQAGKLSLVDGTLRYDTDKFVYVATINGKAQLIVSADRFAEGDYVPSDNIADTLVDFLDLVSLTSDPQIFNVKEIPSPELNINGDFIHNVIESEESGKTVKKVELPLLDDNTVKINGNSKLNLEKSTIVISINGGTGSSTLETIKMSEYKTFDSRHVKYDAAEDKLYLYLIEDGTYTITYSAQASKANGENVSDPTVEKYNIANGDVNKPEISFKTSEKAFLNGRDKDSFTLKDNKLILKPSELKFTDRESSEEYLKEHYSITVKGPSGEVERKGEGDTYEFILPSAGQYTITITVTDEAQWTTTRNITITVGKNDAGNKNVTQVVGTVLIVISCVVLAGVVTYFIVSKVKADKKNKRK